MPLTELFLLWELLQPNYRSRCVQPQLSAAQKYGGGDVGCYRFAWMRRKLGRVRSACIGTLASRGVGRAMALSGHAASKVKDV
jgi:hypothetical protein